MTTGAAATELSALTEAIDRLELSVDREVIVGALRQRDRLDARIAAAVAAFDTAELWDGDGATSMTRWLVNEGRLGDGAARRLVRTAGRLGQWPVLARALAEGTVSAGQVELIAQRVRPHHVERFAEHEAALVPALEPLDLDATITVVREWVERADALVDMSRRFLRDHETPKTAPGRQRPGVNVVIDAPALAALELRELGIGTVGDLDEFLGGQPTTAAVQAWYRSGLEYLMGNEHSAATTLSGHYLSPALAAAFCCDTTMRRLLTTGSAPRRPTTSCSSARGQGGAEVDSCARSEEPAALPRSQCGSPTLAGTTASTERRLGDRTRDPTRSRVIGARHHHVLHRDGWSAHLEPDGTLAVAGPHDRHWAT